MTTSERHLGGTGWSEGDEGREGEKGHEGEEGRLVQTRAVSQSAVPCTILSPGGEEERQEVIRVVFPG